MRNVDIKIDKKKAIITIDLTAEKVVSESNKSLVIATTHGNQRVSDDGLVLGLTAYYKNPDYVKPKKGRRDEED